MAFLRKYYAMKTISFYRTPAKFAICVPAWNHRAKPAGTRLAGDLITSMTHETVTPLRDEHGWGDQYLVKAVLPNESSQFLLHLDRGPTEWATALDEWISFLNENHRKFAAAVKAASTPEDIQSASSNLDAFRALYCDEKNEVFVPELDDIVIVNEGHTRLTQMILVHAVAVCMANGEPWDGCIPVRVVEYDDYEDMLREQLMGNTVSTTHNDLELLDYIQSAIPLVRKGMTESAFRKMSGEGDNGSVGRRAHGIARLHCQTSDYLSPTLFECLMLKGTKEKRDEQYMVPDFIPEEALHTNTKDPFGCVSIALRCMDYDGPHGVKKHFDGKFIKGDRSKVSGFELEVLDRGRSWSEDEVRGWIENRKPANTGGEVRKFTSATPKVTIDGGDLRELGKLSGNKVLADFTSAVSTNPKGWTDTPVGRKLQTASGALSAVHNLMIGDKAVLANAKTLEKVLSNLVALNTVNPELFATALADIVVIVDASLAQAAKLPKSAPALPAMLTETPDQESEEGQEGNDDSVADESPDVPETETVAEATAEATETPAETKAEAPATKRGGRRGKAAE